MGGRRRDVDGTSTAWCVPLRESRELCLCPIEEVVDGCLDGVLAQRGFQNRSRQFVELGRLVEAPVHDSPGEFDVACLVDGHHAQIVTSSCTRFTLVKGVSLIES